MTDRRSFLLGTAATLALAPLSACQQHLGTAKIQRVLASGLAARIEIVDDVYGVPHIRAASKPDAFFGQGYVVARDRMFQIDLTHRRELGRLAEAFGPEFAAHDAANRLFHYRGDVEAELARVPQEVLACAEAYLAGINARIEELERDPALLPLEYRILGVRPLKWHLHDLVVPRSVQMGNMTDEVRRAQLAALGLLDLDTLVAPLRPAWNLKVPEGLDTAAVSEADLASMRVGPLPFSPATPVAPAQDRAEAPGAGSNAWTVSGRRTATGRPILANDPHLGIGGFGPRHVAHLSAPGLDVIGGGQPGLPGIMQGHTDRFAFGRTNFHIDQSDLFVLELHPTDPERYRHDGGWKRFESVAVRIPVKGEAPRNVTLRYAAQGPVLSHDPARRRATAVAAIQMQPGAADSFAMIAINLARDWASLKQAFPFHPSPTNFHYADIEGNHGWQVIGFVPVRKRGEGLMPVPGDGRFDWTGMRNFESLPSEYNPAKGWFASANQNNLPADYPRERIPAFTFREPYRYNRIVDMLSKQERHSLADSVRLQHDTWSAPAAQLLRLLPRQPSEAARPAAAVLAGWNAHLDAQSAPAVLFELLWRELEERMLAAVVPPRAKALITDMAASELLNLLERPDARLGPDPAAARDAIFEAALASAWNEAQRELGPDPAQWRWAQLHQVRIEHPLSRIPAIAAAFPAIAGAGSGGDGYTVMARGVPQRGGWRTTSGASYLQVIDVGAWDNSVMLNLPGQSIDPRSPHYRDHYAPWIAGDMLPMLFSPAAVNARAERRTVLQPPLS